MNQSINTDSKNSKEPQQKYRLGTVSIKILGGGVNVEVVSNYFIMVNQLPDLFLKIRPVNYVTIDSGSDIPCCRRFFKLVLYFSTNPLCRRYNFLTRLTKFMETIALYKDFGG